MNIDTKDNGNMVYVFLLACMHVCSLLQKSFSRSPNVQSLRYIGEVCYTEVNFAIPLLFACGFDTLEYWSLC